MANKRIPQRICVGCGQMKEKRELLRVIKTSEEAIILDSTGRKNGRGAYICQDPECLKKVRRSRGLERSLKTSIPDAVYEELEKEMSALAK